MDTDHLTDQNELFRYGALGTALMDHLDHDPDLAPRALGFHSGTFWQREDRLVAVFSCPSGTGKSRDKVTITALETPQGVQVRHQLAHDH